MRDVGLVNKRLGIGFSAVAQLRNNLGHTRVSSVSDRLASSFYSHYSAIEIFVI